MLMGQAEGEVLLEERETERNEETEKQCEMVNSWGKNRPKEKSGHQYNIQG